MLAALGRLCFFKGLEKDLTISQKSNPTLFSKNPA